MLNFKILNVNYKKIFFINFTITAFLKCLEILSTHLKSFTIIFCDVAELYKLFKYQYLRYDNSFCHNFSSLIYVYRHNFSCICYKLLCITEQHIPALIRFSIINNISISVKRSNFTWVFLMLLAMLILVQYENEKGIVHIFQDTYLESFQIQQLTKMYCFEHINHAHIFSVHVIFFFISNIFHSQLAVKIFFFRKLCFIEFFPIIHVFILINTFSKLDIMVENLHV